MSNNKTFELNIVTPDKVFFSGSVEQVIVDTIDGSRGILKDISPQVLALIAGDISIFANDKWQTASYGKGFISTKGDAVTMLVESANWPDEIDEQTIDRHREDEEARQKSKKSYNDYIIRKANIKKTLTNKNNDELNI